MARKAQTELTEFDLLAACLAGMEQEGLNHTQYRISFDENTLAALNKKNVASTSIEALQRLVDRCFANGWMENTVMGTRYNDLCLTSTGFGAAKSRQRRAEMESQRSIAKKMSDYVLDHRGLFIVLGFVLTLTSVLFTVWRYTK